MVLQQKFPRYFPYSRRGQDERPNRLCMLPCHQITIYKSSGPNAHESQRSCEPLQAHHDQRSVQASSARAYIEAGQLEDVYVSGPSRKLKIS